MLWSSSTLACKGNSDDMGGSRILIIGGTGHLGRHVVRGSVALGHPTFVLVRQSTISNPAKADLLQSFHASGVTILNGSVEDPSSLVDAIKQVDVVISTVGAAQAAHQLNIIKAIKESGTIQRFLPSEFGLDNTEKKVSTAVEPAKSLFATKLRIRQGIEGEGIPYTYVVANAFAGSFLPNLGQQGLTAPPRDKVVILGDGNAKVVYVTEEDIGRFTIRAVDDPRTLNKTLHLRLPPNIFSFNELVALWERKIGKTLEKAYIPEDRLLETIAETPFPGNFFLSINHLILVKGDLTNFEIGADGVDASELYPDVKYTTVDEYLERYV